MNMNTGSTANIERLGDGNYETWRLQMKSVLIYNDLWDYVDGKIKKPEESKAAEISAWKNKDSKALALIVLSLKENQLGYVKNCPTSQETWNKLSDIHASRGPIRKVLLYKQLFQMKKSNEEPMNEHIRHFQEKVDKLEESGISIPNELLSIMLLNTLPAEYENFCIVMETRDKLPDIEVLKVKLLQEEDRKNDRENGESSNQNAFLSSEKPYSHVVNNKRKLNSVKYGRHPQGQTFNGKCHYCGIMGHKQSTCRAKKRHSNSRRNERTAMPAILLEDENFNHSEKWCLDSGASSHMCKDRAKFIKWDDQNRSRIQTAGKDTIQTYGTGTVLLNILKPNDRVHKIKLNGVIYAPDLKQNLISVTKATKNGCQITFKNNFALVKDSNGELVCKAVKARNLYVLEEVSEITMYTKEQKLNDLIIWHQRFGHLNLRDLRKIKKENVVNGISAEFDPKEIKCVTCSKAKLTRQPFKSSENTCEDLLDIIHSDICGPFSTKSIGNSRYFATFIDNKSRYISAAFLKNRSDVFNAFKEFQNRVERETNKKIKVIRTDNAKEYISKEFNNYLKENGIRHQLSIEYTPQQNGIAERANRTLVEMARCMLIGSQLPESLWAEAINTAVFIRNRSPSATNNGKTPVELWTGRKPNVGFFKVFGSRTIALDKRQGKSKFSPKAKDYIFVGYETNSKGYRLWDKTTGQIIKARDVKVFEKYNPQDYLWVNIEPPVCPEEAEKETTEVNDYDEKFKEDPEELESSEVKEVCHDDLQGQSTPNADESGPFLGFSGENLNTNYLGEQSEYAEEGEESDETPKKKRPGRPRIIRTGQRGRPRKVANEEVNIIMSEQDTDPLCFEDILNQADAMNVELSSLEKNGTWTLVDRPRDKKIISNKWVFTKRRKSDGNIQKYKARLVARGCEQRYGIDYDEVFSPVVRYETIRALLAVCAEKNMFIHQMDVVTAYVQGDLDDELYMELPKHSKFDSCKSKVCKLLKPLYGLKQSGRQWHIKLDKFLKDLNMKQSNADDCLYIKEEEGKQIIIAVYVDDLILASNCMNLLENMKSKLIAKFEMKNLGEINNILGMTIKKESRTGSIEVSQKEYIQKLLKKFNMENAKAVTTPMENGFTQSKEKHIPDVEEIETMKRIPYRELIGSLLYLSNTTRPDISYATNMLSRFLENPNKNHWVAAKRILRYLKGTSSYKIIYEKNQNPMHCYTDSDWASDPKDRKSCSGYIIKMANGPICWRSKKQKSVALSTMEAEFISLSEAIKEIIYIRELLKDMGMTDPINIPTTVFCDNQSAIRFAKDKVFHDRSKHIDIRYHFCREKLDENCIKVEYISTNDMIADMLTKPLGRIKHENCVNLTGLK